MIDILQWMFDNGYFVQTSYTRHSIMFSFAWELVDLDENSVGGVVVNSMAADHFRHLMN